jgi:hypothetical protein
MNAKNETIEQAVARVAGVETAVNPAFATDLRARLLADLNPVFSTRPMVAEPEPVEELDSVEPQRVSRSRVGLAAAAVVLIGVGATALAWRAQDRPVRTTSSSTASPADTPPTTSAERRLAAPLPTPLDQPHLWLSSTTLPPTGGPLALAMVNPTATAIGYGVAGKVERWSGTGWDIANSWASSLDFWGGFGSFANPNEDFAVPAIGLNASAGGAGAIEFVRVPPLEPGFYRLSHDGVGGILTIAEGAPEPPPLQGQVPSAIGLMNVSPALVAPAGGPIVVSAEPISIDGSQSRDNIDAFQKSLEPGARIERWDGAAWQAVVAIDTLTAVPERPGAVSLTVPALPESMYRVVRHAPKGDISREFWVTSEVVFADSTETTKVDLSKLPAGWVLVSQSTNFGSAWTFAKPQPSSADANGAVASVINVADDPSSSQPGRGFEIVSKTTVRGRPAVIVTTRDTGFGYEYLLLVEDGKRRLTVRRVGSVSDAELVAVAESFEPFPVIAGDPYVSGRITGSVADVVGANNEAVNEGAASVTGWLVVIGEEMRLCEKVIRDPKLACAGHRLTIDLNGLKWDRPATVRVAGGEVSPEQVTIAGSLKSEFLYPGIL